MPQEKINILQVIRQGKIGGGESHILSIASNIDKTFFNTIVLSFSGGEMIDKLNDLGIKTYIIPTEHAFNIFAWSKVKDIILKERIDIVHAHGTRACSNSFKSATQLRKPLVYTIHGWSFHNGQNRIIRQLRQITESFLCSKANINICVSESNETDGKRFVGLEKSIVIKNGIDLKRFDPDRRFKDLRNEFHYSSKTIVVGFIARLTEQKDPFTFLQAAKLIIENTENIEYIIVGDGNLMEASIRLAKELKIESYVRFFGSRDDIPDLLNIMDIYCLPSLWEGLPIAILEAMAMRKAIVATGVDGTKELIITGKNGLLITPEDPKQIANAVLRLSKDEKLRKTLGQNARKSAEDFDVKKMTRKLEDVYRSLVNI